MVSKLLVFVPFISISRRLKSKSSIYVHDISTYIEKNNFNGTCGIQCIVPYINPYILLILLISSNVCFFFHVFFLASFFFFLLSFAPPSFLQEEDKIYNFSLSEAFSLLSTASKYSFVVT